MTFSMRDTVDTLETQIMQPNQVLDNSLIQHSDRQNRSLIVTSWFLIALVCVLSLVPVFGFGTWLIAGPILFITLVMGIIVLSRGGTVPGLFILLVLQGS